MTPNLEELIIQNKTFMSNVSINIKNNKCNVCDCSKEVGLNYGGISCEACSKFFRRSVLFKKQYKCNIINECLVTEITRNQCASCRYYKCLAINMNQDQVQQFCSNNNLSDSDKENECDANFNFSNNDKENILQTVEYNTINYLNESLSNYEKIFINKIASVFYNSSESLPYGLDINKKLDENYKRVARYAFGDLICKIVNKFAEQLYDFKNLNKQDQIKLLQNAAIPIFIWQFSIIYQNDIMDHLHLIWDDNVIEKTKLFLKSLNLINIDRKALILIVLLNLFSPDRADLIEKDTITRIQTKYSFLLKKYVLWIYGKEEGEKKYNKIILKLIDLRTIEFMGKSLLLSKYVDIYFMDSIK